MYNRQNSKKSSNAQDPNLKFRNTKSKFYKQKSSEFDQTGSSQADKDQKNTGNYWKQQGNLEVKNKNFLKAIQFYSKAIEKNSTQSVYFSNRAKCYKQLKNFKQALKDSQQACELDDENIKAHYLCGSLLAELGKTDHAKLIKAENRLKKALRLCGKLKKSQFQQEISMKIYRLKKLEWFIERQKEIGDLIEQKNLLSSLSSKTSSNIIQRLDKRILILTSRSDLQIPQYLFCKITLQLMEEPVTTEQGISYQRSALEDHFKINGMIEPLTRKKLNNKPYPNLALKNAILGFIEDNPWAFEEGVETDYLDIQF